MNCKEKGSACEGFVCEFLTDKGYIILAKNFRCPDGEIDIIANKDKKICFVEVKSFPETWPIEDISRKVPVSKQMKIKKTAFQFLETQEHIQYDDLRFDVALVSGKDINYFKGAF